MGAMRTGSRNARWTVLVAAIVTAVVAAVFGYWGAAPATAAPSTFTHDAAAYVYDAPARLASSDPVAPGARGAPAGPGATSWARSVFVGGDVVAANTGADVVLYSPQAASRNVLGQLGEGFATTPGGRTVSAHAADRIVNGAAGRGPTTLSRVDDILDSPTALRYDPLRDTVRVSQGKDFVVVRGSGSDQHIVTVMVP